MRVLASSNRRKNRIPVNYKIIPLTKGIIQGATDVLKSISPDVNVNYSEFIEDAVFHLLETDTIIYQVDKERFTLADLLKKHLKNTEEGIKKYVEEHIEGWKEEVKEELKENLEYEWGTEIEAEFDIDSKKEERMAEAREDIFLDLENEGYEEDSQEFEDMLEERLSEKEQEIEKQLKKELEEEIDCGINDRLEEQIDYGDFEENLFEKLYEEIEFEFGPIFEISEAVDPEWRKYMDNYFVLVFERSNFSIDNEMLSVIGILFKNRLIYMNQKEEIDELYKEGSFKNKVYNVYIELKMLIEKIKQEYGKYIFNESSEEAIKKITITEALNESALKHIAKKAQMNLNDHK